MQNYEEFVEKFKPKLTTDDCYTPPLVYDAVADWVANEYGLDRANFVRPFYPGGDYENYDYKETDIVVDNPPFSILTKICETYQKRGIKFFLFAPSLTLFKRPDIGACSICTGAGVIYENGAQVNTSFLTNLEPGICVRSAPELYKAIKVANDETQRQTKKSLPKYNYPIELITSFDVTKFSKYGIDFRVACDEAHFTRTLDSQRGAGKGVYGAGYLISKRAAAERAAAERAAAERAAAERAAAERAAAERAAAHVWELSDREREIIKSLGRGK